MKNIITLTSAPLEAARWYQKASFWQLALWCVLGLATSAQASHSPRKAAAGPNEKVLICHKGHDLYISSNAVQAHLSQHPGDKLGSCSGGGGQEGRTVSTSATQPAATLLR